MQGGVLGMVPFDPAGLNSDKMAEREIKNGRLAMIAFLGIASQAAVRVRFLIACTLLCPACTPCLCHICHRGLCIEVAVVTMIVIETKER